MSWHSDTSVDLEDGSMIDFGALDGSPAVLFDGPDGAETIIQYDELEVERHYVQLYRVHRNPPMAPSRLAVASIERTAGVERAIEATGLAEEVAA